MSKSLQPIGIFSLNCLYFRIFAYKINKNRLQIKISVDKAVFSYYYFDEVNGGIV